MKRSSKESSIDVLYLEDSVKAYAEQFLSADKKKEADLNKPTINWDQMHITYGDTEYFKSGDFTKPKSHVLFTANFTNDTPSPQTYSLRTERRTTNTSTLSFKKTFTYGGNLKLTLSPPSSPIGASVGFKKEISGDSGVTRVTEHELSWSVDNQITVPPGHQTKARLFIKEDTYSGDFLINCTFQGRVVVSYFSKQSKTHMKTVSAPVKECFEGVKEFIKDNLNRPVFVVRGCCEFKFGIEQNVSLEQMKIHRKSDNEESVGSQDDQFVSLLQENAEKK